MENELKIFKKKIAARYAGRQIVDWKFPYVDFGDLSSESDFQT